MDQLSHRRNEVRALRAGLAKSLREVGGRLSPPELVEDAVLTIDPDRRFLGGVQAGLKRHPVLAAILLAGAGWLLKEGLRKSGTGSNRPRRTNKTPKTRTNKGGYHDTQHHGRNQWSNTGSGEKQDRPQP